MNSKKLIILFFLQIQLFVCIAQQKSNSLDYFSATPLSYFDDIEFLKSELGFVETDNGAVEQIANIKSDARDKLVLQNNDITLEYRKFRTYYIVRADVVSQTDFIPWSNLIGKSKDEVLQTLGRPDSLNDHNNSALYFLNYLYTAVIYYENDIVVKIRLSEND